MKVVFEVIGMGAKKYGGFEHYILEEARQLNSQGNKLVVIFSLEPLAKEYTKDLLDNGASFYVIPFDNKLLFIKKLIRLINKYNPEVIHTNFSSCIFIVHLIAFLKRIPRRIATEHCLPVISSLKLKFGFSLLASIVHNILPVSEESSNALKRGLWFYKSKVQALYLGVSDFSYNNEEMRIKYNLPSDKILLMNIAYHNPVKGVDILLRAFAKLIVNYQIDDLILCQIGGGQTGYDTEKLKTLAKELNIENKIIWMGLQNNVPEILSAGDIYCQPSRSEGIGLSIMEASLAQLPIIATRIGGIPEAAIEGLNAVLVPVEDYNRMSEAIYRFYNDKKLRQEYGVQGRRYALENFSLKSQVDRLITNYY